MVKASIPFFVISIILLIPFSPDFYDLDQIPRNVDSRGTHNSVPVVVGPTFRSADIDVIADEPQPDGKKKKNNESMDAPNNHMSGVTIADDTPPSIEKTSPEDAERRIPVDVRVNVTFSEPMQTSTINDESFTLQSEFGEFLAGTVSYDSSSNTATFEPEEALNFGEVYFVTLTNAIQDKAGNSLETTIWSFTTGGRIRIQLQDVQTSDLLGGSAFTITPNPFTLQDSLSVEDNGIYDSDFVIFGEPKDGIVFIDNVENNFTTYVFSETVVPNGYSRIYGDSIVTAVQKNACDLCVPVSILGLHNLRSSVNITDVGDLILVTRPDLNMTQFELYDDRVVIGVFSGIQGNLLSTTARIESPGSSVLPQAYIATNNTIHLLPVLESFNFEVTVPPTLTGEEIIQEFEVATYPGPIEELARFATYAVPAVVIPYEGSANNFVLTPVIDKIHPGLTLLLNQSSFVESKIASVRQVSMIFDTAGTMIGFSFGISDSPPPGTPEPPLDVSALFLDVGFVGDVDFSDPHSFQSSPAVDIVVNKTITGFDQLEDGCSDFQVLIFNEASGEWEIVEKLRNPDFDTEGQCGFTLQPEHFSKFAVGGVKGQTVPTESPPEEREGRNKGSGGGGKRSTGITNPLSGNDVETTVATALGAVTVRFDSIEAGSGQLHVNTNDLSAYREIFSDVARMAQDNDEHGIVHLDGATYVTAGNIFDIDASNVDFQAMVEVTIPYDEGAAISIGSESNVRFLHYNEVTGVWQDDTTSMDELANTVTGRLSSLSPVMPAVIVSQSTVSNETYFEENPQARMEITNAAFRVSSGTEEVTLSATLKNIQRIHQSYFIVVQIVDENNVVQYIEWETGSLHRNGDSNFTMNWNPEQEGIYNIMIMLWTDMNNPSLLSKTVREEIPSKIFLMK